MRKKLIGIGAVVLVLALDMQRNKAAISGCQSTS
jgi:hypothetical protein